MLKCSSWTLHCVNVFITPFSAPEKIEMILLRGFLSSGTDGSGLELWLTESESFPEPVLKMVLLILTGGAGGLSSGSPLSHIALGGCKPHRGYQGWGSQRTTMDRVTNREGTGQRSHQHEAQVCSRTTGVSTEGCCRKEAADKTWK